MDDIFKQVGELEVVQDFLSEHAPSPEARVRSFLAAQYGAGWREAIVVSQVMPGGASTWVAWLQPLPGEFVLFFVAEAPDGRLGTSTPLYVFAPAVSPDAGDAQDGDGGGIAAEHEQSPPQEAVCIGLIGAAFARIARVLRGTELPPEEKKYLVSQMQHARNHLRRELERRRRGGRE